MTPDRKASKKLCKYTVIFNNNYWQIKTTEKFSKPQSKYMLIMLFTGTPIRGH